MRPDEHKKKKNAAYKKKHNIHTGSKSGSTSQEKDSRRIERLSDDCQQTDSTSQREELELSKVYCRRKIENNWEKYEEAASTETEADLHPADYGELLKATRIVNAQYQFPSFEAEDVELSNGQVAEFLSIDCEHLTQSVRCVPLHQRLHINELLFDKSEIDAFNAAALDKLSQYEQTKTSVKSAYSSHVLNVETAESCQCVSDLKLKSPAVSTQCPQHLVTPSSSAAAASSDLAVNVGCCESVADKTLSQLEDELDSLLSV